MSRSNFDFLAAEWPALFESAAKAEALAHPDARQHEVAYLPAEIEAEDEEAKRFDVLILRLQLVVLRGDPGFEHLRDVTIGIAGLLEEKATIPAVQQQLRLIEELQTEEWWQDVTAPMLEVVRRRLRSLVRLIDKRERKIIYTDFEDDRGEESEVALPGFTPPDSYERFRAKARQFLRAHENHIAIHKLRTNAPLTPADLGQLERMLIENGVGAAEDVERAKKENHGLGLFVRSLVGLDREAAKAALGGFMAGKTLRANQIEFLDLIVNHLTECGSMEPRLLYEPPYTDFNSLGVDGVFASKEVDEILGVLAEVRRRAAA